MARAKKVLSHFMVHTAWDDEHVNVAYRVEAEIDGQRFSNALEANLTSPAVMKHARALQAAIAKELNAEPMEKESVRHARLAAERAARHRDEIQNEIEDIPADVAAVNAGAKSSARKSSARQTKRR